MSRVIELAEYESVEVPLTAAVAGALARVTDGKLVLTQQPNFKTWTIKATANVGTVVVPGLKVLIKPKVSEANLFHMLEAGGEALSVRYEVFEYEQSADLMPAFATFYSSVLERSLAQGIPKQYRVFEDRLIVLRGRVDVKQQTQRVLPIPVACRFDEHTPDVPVNRLVRAAAVVLLDLPGVTISTRQTLMRLVLQLEGVGEVSPADLEGELTFTRLDEHMEIAARLARLVLAGSAIAHGVGAAGVSTFLINMNSVFETYLEHRLRRALAGRLELTGQYTMTLDESGHVGMRPDIVLTRAGRPRYVGDAKYKLTASGFGREPDYYQLHAYVTSLDLSEGVLVYCQHEGDVPPREVVVRHSGKRLFTKALTLSGTPAELDTEIGDLADWIVGRVADRSGEARLADGADIAAATPLPVG